MTVSSIGMTMEVLLGILVVRKRRLNMLGIVARRLRMLLMGDDKSMGYNDIRNKQSNRN